MRKSSMKKQPRKWQGRVGRKMKMKGSAERPRVSVFRSHKHLYVQLIDDTKGRVLLASSDREFKEKKKGVEFVRGLAKLIVEKAKEQGIEKVIFDRGRYAYHGKIKMLAEELRAGGILS